MLAAQADYGTSTGERLCRPELAMGRRLFLALPEDKGDPAVHEGSESRFFLTGDLRIDNRQALAAALNAPDLLARSDLHLLGRSLEHWGIEETLSRLVGDFAFAFYQKDHRKLTLARDFLGQKPLHYHRRKDFVAFASMPKGLHALPGVGRAPDRQALIDFLALLPDPRGSSFYEGINSVAPGHFVEIDSAGARSVEYWKPSLEPLILPDPEAYEEALLEHFDNAVRARLRGAGERVGTHLSSGLDSSAVTTSAALQMRDRGGRVTAFTAVPAAGAELDVRPGQIGDEGPLAAQTASLYPNIDHIKVTSGGRSPFDNLDRHFRLFDRPPLNPVNHAWIDAVNDEAERRGLHVLLIGQKGNMSASFSGLTRLPTLLREGRLVEWSKLGRQLYKAGMGPRAILGRSLVPLFPELAWRLYARAWNTSSAVGEYSLIDPDILEHEKVRERAIEAHHDLLYQPGANGQQMRLGAIRQVDMGNYNKGMIGGWGLDYRDPTADRRLVEFCLRVPEQHFISEGVPRALIRRALKGRLPSTVLDNRKLGVQSADWHLGISGARSQLSATAERLVALNSEHQLLDTNRLESLLRDWPQGVPNGSRSMAYRHVIPRAVSAMNFVRFAAGLN